MWDVRVLFVFALFSCDFCDEDRRPTACNLPIETGPCDHTVYKYSFKAEHSECIRYIYHGCGGNANQFDTMSECRKTCETNEDIDYNRRPSQCSLPIENYICDGTIHKYAYDIKRSMCVRYLYEGCAGNANQFDTMSECRKTCEVSNDKRPRQCSLPIITFGPDCNTSPRTRIMTEEVSSYSIRSVSVLRYAFDVDQSQCVRFTHLGCHGNANRFDTLDECRKTCEVNE